MRVNLVRLTTHMVLAILATWAPLGWGADPAAVALADRMLERLGGRDTPSDDFRMRFCGHHPHRINIA